MRDTRIHIMLSQAFDTTSPRTHYPARKSLALLNPVSRTTEFFRYKRIFVLAQILSGKAQTPCPFSQKQPNNIGGGHWLACIGSIPYETLAPGSTFQVSPAEVLSNLWGVKLHSQVSSPESWLGANSIRKVPLT